MCDVEVIVYRGFGGLSKSLGELVRSEASRLRSYGVNVCILDLRLPVLDEEIKPFMIINGKVYDVDKLSALDLILLSEALQGGAVALASSDGLRVKMLV